MASSEHERLRQAMSQQPGAYFVLQRFLPEIAHGETRTIIVGGQIIGSYLRVPTNNFHANLAKKALTQRTELSAAQLSLVKTLNADMLDQHIGFAAIDLVGETLMEVNIANPGIGTLHSFTKGTSASISSMPLTPFSTFRSPRACRRPPE